MIVLIMKAVLIYNGGGRLPSEEKAGGGKADKEVVVVHLWSTLSMLPE
jgi:hypothetical protein